MEKYIPWKWKQKYARQAFYMCIGMTQRDGTGRKEGSGWGTHVYLWWTHVDIWQNQYNIVKLKNTIKLN